MTNETPIQRRRREPTGPQAEILASAAAARAVMRDEPAREPVRERLRTRKRPGNVDKFYIPKEMIPTDTTYEWKRETVYGASDPSYDVSLRENGWEPVDVSRHPEFMPPGYRGAIKRDGLVLMERPTYLTQEARAEDDENARELIRAKEQQLGSTPQGTLTREHPTARPAVRRSYAPLEVPND